MSIQIIKDYIKLKENKNLINECIKELKQNYYIKYKWYEDSIIITNIEIWKPFIILIFKYSHEPLYIDQSTTSTNNRQLTKSIFKKLTTNDSKNS